ncbi:dihydrofolate reductase family protein [Nocardioides aestuarii]|uniref:Dihydrofolate reductase family protein n=1 Tax=Nocardioides aestuarii TaxID=252231 RepID=A0ABW4TJX8_9ACTN
MTQLVRWHTLMSLDGFIAGPHDEMGWALGAQLGSGETVDEIVGSTGALLVGRRTQDVEDRDQPGFYGGAFSGPFLVLRHHPPVDPPVVKGVTGRFLDVGIVEAVAIAKEAAGGADVGVLGAAIARQCLEAGLLDEVVVHVAPVLLGDGVRLFESRNTPAVGLHLVSATRDGDLTALRYTL